MSVHGKGRICILDDVDIDNLQRGIQPNCRDHMHAGREHAFELTRSPRLGRLLAFLGSSASTPENPAPAGCFVEIGGVVEYTHLRKTTKPNLKAIYALGERIARARNMTFRRRTFYPAV